MAYQFTCPYCFREMRDDEVLFRSERVTSGRGAPAVADSAQRIVDVALPADTPAHSDEERDALAHVRRTLVELLKSGAEITREDLYPEEDYDSWRDFENRFPDCELKARLGRLEGRLKDLRNAQEKARDAASASSDAFFNLTDDPVYQRFWEKFAGGRTTETDTEHDREPWRTARRRLFHPRRGRNGSESAVEGGRAGVRQARMPALPQPPPAQLRQEPRAAACHYRHYGLRQDGLPLPPL